MNESTRSESIHDLKKIIEWTDVDNLFNDELKKMRKEFPDEPSHRLMAYAATFGAATGLMHAIKGVARRLLERLEPRAVVEDEEEEDSEETPEEEAARHHEEIEEENRHGSTMWRGVFGLPHWPRMVS